MDRPPIVAPYDQQGAHCPHALNALCWASPTHILCGHCGRSFVFAPYEEGEE